MTWILVKDKKPKYDSNFLGYFDDGKMEVIYHWAASWESMFKHVQDNKLTHWMPLPEPPSEDKKKV